MTAGELAAVVLGWAVAAAFGWWWRDSQAAAEAVEAETEALLRRAAPLPPGVADLNSYRRRRAERERRRA